MYCKSMRNSNMEMIFKYDFMIYIGRLEFCCQDEDFDPDAPLPPVPPDPPQDVEWHLSISMAFMAAVLKINSAWVRRC